ncbi:hypothetical protein SFC07_02655 [Corynebacterium callunae]|uniref:hypothetical protein n=1 Tax=Corynebacterium callunae TaxID=1721 RepID=UPI0039819810
MSQDSQDKDNADNFDAENSGGEHSDADRFDEDGFQRYGQSEWSAGVRPKYEPTSHPEDAPGGLRPYGAAGSQAQDPYSGYSAGQQGSYGVNPYPDPNAGYQAGAFQGAGYRADAYQSGTAGQLPLETGTGHVDLMRAVKFGFRTVFANPAIWILGTIVLGIAYMLISGLSGMIAFAIDPEGTATAGNSMLSPANLAVNVLMFIISSAVTISVLAGALVAVDGQKTALRDFFKPQNVSQTVLLLFIIGVFSLVLSSISSGIATNAITVDEVAGTFSVDESSLGILAVGLLIIALLSPLYSFWTFYTADGKHTAASAVSQGIKDAARNYPKLLLFQILGGFVLVVFGLVTLLLGFIVLIPAYFLACAHLYRQMSGGAIPAELRV